MDLGLGLGLETEWSWPTNDDVVADVDRPTFTHVNRSQCHHLWTLSSQHITSLSPTTKHFSVYTYLTHLPPFHCYLFYAVYTTHARVTRPNNRAANSTRVLDFYFARGSVCGVYCDERVCVCVCVCVCVSVREDITGTTCTIFTNCFVRVASPPPVEWQNPRGRGNFCFFLPHWQFIVQHSIWTQTKTAAPIEMPFGMMTLVGPRYLIHPPSQEQFLGENIAAQCKVMGNSTVSCEKIAEQIDWTCCFGWRLGVGPRNNILDGGADPLWGRGNFRGCLGHLKALANGNLRCSGRYSRATAFAAKRDHSIS